MHYTTKLHIVARRRKRNVSFSATTDMKVSRHSEYQDYEWSVTLNRACLRMYGVWPDDDNERRRWLLNARVIFILIIMIFSTAIPTLHSLVRIWGNLASIIGNLQFTLPLLMSILKIFLMWWNKDEFVPIMKMIKEDWLKLKTKEERNVMIRRARVIRIITICGYIMILFLLSFDLILPVFGVSIRYVTNATDLGKPMPVETYYIYNADKSPFYEITYALQGVTVISAGAMYTGTDNFLCLLVFHMCGQLENLKARILRLDENNFEYSLSYSVQDHRRLIRSIKIIDNIFTVMMLGLLIYFGLLFALYGFLFVSIISQGSDLSLGRFIFMILAFVSTFMHMCLYCILGEILVIQSEGVYEAVCEYAWYKLKSRKARNLLIIMIRSNRPLYLTAGKLFPMTMSTFCSLLKTSAGYISFLVAHRD